MKNHLGKTIGVVQVLNKTRGDFTDDDADILAALATQAAVSIDNSRLFMSVTQKNIQLLDTKEQLEHRVRDLKLLFDLERAMARATSLEELFMAVLGEAMRACEARMGAVALRDPEDGSGTLYLIDERAKKMRRLPYPEDAGLIGWAISNNEVLITSDAENDSRRDHDVRRARRRRDRQDRDRRAARGRQQGAHGGDRDLQQARRPARSTRKIESSSSSSPRTPPPRYACSSRARLARARSA